MHSIFGNKFNLNQVLISAELNQLSPRENIQRTTELRDVLGTGAFRMWVGVRGVYKGSAESAFLVTLKDYEYGMDYLLRLAREFGQESILELKQGHGWLHYMDGREEYLGRIIPAIGVEPSYTELIDGTRFTFTKE